AARTNELAHGRNVWVGVVGRNPVSEVAHLVSQNSGGHATQLTIDRSKGPNESQVAQETESGCDYAGSDPAESVSNRLQSDRAVLGQYRPIHAPIKPRAQPALCPPDQIFGFLRGHCR